MRGHQDGSILVGWNRQMSRSKEKKSVQQPARMEPRYHFTPHREDPFLNLSEAGRLIGRSHTTIRRWLDDELIECIRDERGIRRIRRSALIRFTGITAFAAKSPYIWVQEAELPDDYQYKPEYPRPKLRDSITYYPVPLFEEEQTNGEDTIPGPGSSS